ncbi:hypothetical protein KSF_079980 [Reticulibacter mediterranei]|uniref:Uncharacterized protein n=1 Tax=Reticulibacter mediterranei TaxID=2778369 RepID=A0A8J3IW81_9CHLR|nr:hypothetical protein [Reticulibacter mediterranei]GHO97950.1 hypothetical protein KSF_079980 [Reticulibacter mediterranei]
MAQHRTTNRSNVWPVVFPEEKLIVKRPCLRYICQGSTQLGELLSYFLYEAGREAREQNIDPLTIHTITICRIYDEILVTIDNSVSKRVLGDMIHKLERLGFLQTFPHKCYYSIFVENIRCALAHYAQRHTRRLMFSRTSLPNSIVCLPTTNDVVLTSTVADVHLESADVHPESVGPSLFDIATAPTSQAASMGSKDDARDKRDKKEGNREIGGEADAIATPSSSLSSPFPIVQEPSSPQKGIQEGATPGEMAAKLQNEQNIVEDINNIKIVDGGPEKPDCTQPVTVEALQALADYYRGYQLPHNKKPNSQYRMALEAAITLVGRKKTLAEVDAVFSYMKGVNQAFCDDWWPMQTVDLWHVARHFDSMMRKIVHRRAYATVASAISQIEQSRATVALMEMSLEERRAYLSQIREKMQQGIQ